MDGEFQPLPVIHGSALELSVGQYESQGPHQMKLRSGRHAQARDLAGVGRNLRPNQRHFQLMRSNDDIHISPRHELSLPIRLQAHLLLMAKRGEAAIGEQRGGGVQ